MLLIWFLLLLAFGAALARIPSSSTNNAPRSSRQVLAWVATVFVLNTVGVAVYVTANQLLLDRLGFIELPILAAIDLTSLLMSYGLAAVATSKFAPLLWNAGTGIRTSARVLLPLLVMGVAFARYHALSYCSSGWPADPRCEAVFRLL